MVPSISSVLRKPVFKILHEIGQKSPDTLACHFHSQPLTKNHILKLFTAG